MTSPGVRELPRELSRDQPRQALVHRTALLAVVSLVAGLLVAAVALPVVGGLGLASRKIINKFDQLPSDIRPGVPPQRSRILARDGSVIATFYYEDRVSVPLEKISPAMRQSIVAIEDSRFYEHSGVDLKGILRAVLTNSRAGSIRQGGSTITQQYVKNVLIERASTAKGRAAAHADTLDRKIREVRYAQGLEHRYSKDQILDGYLNIAFFGEGAYGIETASRRYFNEHAYQLTLAQAATLAGLVRSPTRYDPILNPAAARDRRDVVLARMHDLGYIDDPEYARAVAQPLGLHPTPLRSGCEDSSAPFFCDYVVRRFIADPALARTRNDRRKLLLRGGLDIRTTLSRRIQRIAQHSVDQKVGRSNRFAGAIAMVQPGTGHVLAIAENRDFGASAHGKHHARETEVDYATDKAYGGSSGFQSGSTFKIFTLTAALEEGIPLGLTIHAPDTVDYATLQPTTCSGAPAAASGIAHNAEGSGGTYNLLTGTWDSINTFFLELEQRTGLCKIKSVAQSMGVRQASGAPLEEVPSLTLGVEPVSPLAMAGAYATFAAQGKYCPATVITKVTDPSGHSIAPTRPQCRQVISRGIANTVTSVLQGVITRGTGVGLGIGRPAAGKTGTVTAFHGAWFCGFTPQIAAAAMVVDPLRPQQDPVLDVTLGDRFVSEGFGAVAAGPIWQQAMIGAMAGKPVVDFPPADSTVARGSSVTVPDVSGMAAGEAQSQLHSAGFNSVVSSSRIRSNVAAGLVAATSPVAGSGAYPGETITIYLSNGHPPLPPPTKTTPGPTGKPRPSGTPSTRPHPTPPATHSPNPPPPPPPHGHGHKKHKHGGG